MNDGCSDSGAKFCNSSTPRHGAGSLISPCLRPLSCIRDLSTTATITERIKLAKRNSTWFRTKHAKGVSIVSHGVSRHITHIISDDKIATPSSEPNLPGYFHQSRTFLSIEYKPVGIFPPIPGHHIQGKQKNPSTLSSHPLSKSSFLLNPSPKKPFQIEPSVSPHRD